MNQKPIGKGDVVSIEIEDLAYGGLGVGKLDGFVVFVEQALPGERVAARIVKKKHNHAQAVIESIERPSPFRVSDPPCPLFGSCGGCTWQNFIYDQQLVWKQKQVVDTLAHIGNQHDFEVLPIVGSPVIWRYRNKMEFTFGVDGEGKSVLGFHEPGRYDRIFDVPACLIQPEPLDAMLAEVQAYVREYGLEAYDPREHKKFLRHAMMRHSRTTGESILVLITNHGELPDKERLAERLAARVPGFKGMMWALFTGISDIARIEKELWRWGDPELIETVNGLTFRISAQSFFQTNTAAAEFLYARVVEMALLEPGMRVLDAFCGAGSIALHCARKGVNVVGVEMIREAIWDARDNARRNNIEGVTFLAAPMDEGLALAKQAAGGGEFSRVIIDPPRGGMDKRSRRGLVELGAPVFVYVSCNPATLARDLVEFEENGYKIEAIQPVDLFPHTYHIETIVRLRRVVK